MSDNLEYCFKCDEPTGCAGRADDSHYNEDGEGPFCWRCWCVDENPRLYEEVDELQAENKKLREDNDQLGKDRLFLLAEYHYLCRQLTIVNNVFGPLWMTLRERRGEYQTVEQFLEAKQVPKEEVEP